MTDIKAEGVGGIYNKRTLTTLRFCAWAHMPPEQIRQKLLKSPSRNEKNNCFIFFCKKHWSYSTESINLLVLNLFLGKLWIRLNQFSCGQEPEFTSEKELEVCCFGKGIDPSLEASTSLWSLLFSFGHQIALKLFVVLSLQREQWCGFIKTHQDIT